MKNDITYEYRVFTNRLIDVEPMEVGKCTSKVIKELKQKDKVDGRFFHTSDSDEWFFCWNGVLQKLNLKGDSDVNAALAEIRELISKAEVSVENANTTAQAATAAAESAQNAAREANAAVESIGNKADKSDVEAVSKAVESKADKSDVEAVSKAVESKADKSDVDTLSAKVDAIKVPSLDGYATEKFVADEISNIDIPEVPTNVSAFENDAKYLTEDAADLKYAPIGSEGVDLSDYATKKFVYDEIANIDIPEVPTNVSAFENDAKYLTADNLTEYATKSATRKFVEEEISKINIPEVPTKVSAFENDANYLTEHQSLDNYYTKGEVDKMIEDINALIESAIEKTNTILA
jgi:hypothetical protein